MSNPTTWIRRTAIFAGHLPFRRVLWRVWLVLKRHVLVHVRRGRGRPRPATLGFRGEGFVPLFRHMKRSLAVTPDGLAFSFLGRTVQMSRTVTWHPEASPRVGQLWTMNLHYNEFLTGLPDALFADLTDQWIAANPCYGSGYWRDAWHAYALSIRTVVWMEELVQRDAGLPQDVRGRLRASIEKQLCFLARNIERDIGGNHVIKNIRALATGGRLFEGGRARDWTRLACRLIRQELDEQVLADGGHFERSPSYHGEVFADLLSTRLALSQTAGVEQAVIDHIDGALRRMSQFAADLVHPDGLVPLFNDAGLSMATSPDTQLSAYERVYGSRPLQRANFAFPESGYFGFRHEDIYLVVDCGPLGADVLMAHAHGDALSFELSVSGQRLVVDQGVYEYEAGDRRAASRSARSHNTVCIERSDQAEFFGAFRCGSRPKVDLLHYAPRPEGFVLEGRHDGFSRLTGGPRHSRRFELTSNRLDIHDRLDARVADGVSSSLLLHPHCQVTRSGADILVSNGAMRVSIASSVIIVVEPAIYWPDMGIEIPTQRLRFCWAAGSQEATIQLRVLQSG